MIEYPKIRNFSEWVSIGKPTDIIQKVAKTCAYKEEWRYTKFFPFPVLNKTQGGEHQNLAYGGNGVNGFGNRLRL